jgi:hypothetical protein
MAKESKSSANEKQWDCPPEATREHIHSARKEMREAWKALFPPEFIEHRRAARREFLMAARTFIDHAIERMDAREQA